VSCLCLVSVSTDALSCLGSSLVPPCLCLMTTVSWTAVAHCTLFMTGLYGKNTVIMRPVH